MTDQQKIQDLEAKLAQKTQDEKELAEFIFQTFRSMGVKKFDDLDNVGKTVLKEASTIILESTIARHKLAKRFAHFQNAMPLLEKYKHLIPQD